MLLWGVFDFIASELAIELAFRFYIDERVNSHAWTWRALVKRL